MKKYLVSFAVLLMGTTLFTACSDDNGTSEPSQKFTPEVFVGDFQWEIVQMTVRSGNVTGKFGQGDRAKFYADGTCEGFSPMETAYVLKDGKIETYNKESSEPMYVYTLLSNGNSNSIQVRVNGTLDDDFEAVMTLTKLFPVNESNGLFIVGSGNKRAGIDGNVSYINYTSGDVVPNMFRTVNSKTVGKTANYIEQYGNKIYIVVDAEATIWVCEKQTLKVIKQISTTSLLGETDGVSPRAAIGHDGKLYFTCYGDSYNGGNGIVAVMDTVKFEKQETYTVGSYPDGLTLANNSIYVANSDYGNGINPSISKIDLGSGKVTTIKDEVITNPMQILTVGSDVYYLDYGTYDASWNQTGAGVRKITADGTVSKVVDGTAMCSDGSTIYTVYAPYGGDGTHYYKYNVAAGSTTEWEPADVFSPAVIAADPITGNVFIVSYQENPDTGYAGYALPSYTNQYDSNGKFIKKYEGTATGPISVVFNTGVKYTSQLTI